MATECMLFVLSLIASHFSFVYCLGKTVLRYCIFSYVFSYIFFQGSGEAGAPLSKSFCIPSEKGSIRKGNNQLCPLLM